MCQAGSCARAPRPTRSSIARARSAATASGSRSSHSGSATFCSRLRWGRMWKAWNTKPKWLRRSRAMASSSRQSMREGPTWISPPSAGSRPAMQLSSVDLPTPDSPTIATHSPAPTRSDSRSNSTRGGVPGRVLHRWRSSSMAGESGEGAEDAEDAVGKECGERLRKSFAGARMLNCIAGRDGPSALFRREPAIVSFARAESCIRARR